MQRKDPRAGNFGAGKANRLDTALEETRFTNNFEALGLPVLVPGISDARARLVPGSGSVGTRERKESWHRCHKNYMARSMIFLSCVI
jgi:hypothetical protein